MARTVVSAMRKYKLKVIDFLKAIQTPSLISHSDLAWVVSTKNPYTLESMYFGS